MEEERICRVCRCGAEEDNPLFHPCHCSGSIKYVHQDCIKQWLDHTGSRKCELCNVPFQFSMVYRNGAPALLGPGDFLKGLASNLAGHFPLLARVFTFVLAYMILFPILTSQVWRLYFNVQVSSFPLLLDLIWGTVFMCMSLLCLLILILLLIYVHSLAPNHPALEGRNVRMMLPPQIAENFEDVPIVGDRMGQIMDQRMNEDTLGNLLGAHAGPVGVMARMVVIFTVVEVFHASFIFVPHTTGSIILSTCIYIGIVSKDYASLLVSERTSYVDVSMIKVWSIGYSGMVVTACASLFLLLILLGNRNLLHHLQCSNLLINLYKALKLLTLFTWELGCIPFLAGLYLDIGTLPLFKGDISMRMEFLYDQPLLFLFLHWLTGSVYLMVLVSAIQGISKSFRRRVLWFLENLEDPNFDPLLVVIERPLLKLIRRKCIILALHCIGLGIVVTLPILITSKLFPVLFPIRMTADFSDWMTLTQLPIFFFPIPALLEMLRLRSLLGWMGKLLLRHHAKQLGIEDFLYQRYNERGEELPPIVPSFLYLRSVFYVGYVLITLGTVHAVGFSGIYLVSKILSKSLDPFIQIDDHIAMMLVVVAFMGVCRIFSNAIRYLEPNNPVEVYHLLFRFGFKVLSAALVGVLWFGVVSFLVGLLNRFVVMVPVGVGLSYSPTYHFKTDWGFGFFYLQLWTKIVVAGPRSRWKTALLTVWNGGIMDFDSLSVLRMLVLPVMSRILLFLCLPYAIAGVIAQSGVLPVVYATILVRMSHSMVPLVHIGYLSVKMIGVGMCKLHNKIRDDQYLEGFYLLNNTEAPEHNDQ